MKKNLIIGLLLLSLISPHLFAQDSSQQIKVVSRLVHVKVLDKEGVPVKGLLPEHFSIFVNGSNVAINSLDEYDYGFLRSDKVNPIVDVKEEFASLPERKIILLFDIRSSVLANNEYGAARGIFQSREAAKRWVKNDMLAYDRVAVMTYDRGPKLLHAFTNNQNYLLNALEQVKLPHGSGTRGMFGEDALNPDKQQRVPRNEIVMYRRQYTQRYHVFLNNLAEILGKLPGTKQVILFSEGMTALPELWNITARTNRELSERAKAQGSFSGLIRASIQLSSANCRMSTIGTAGLERIRTRSSGAAYMALLAQETGGHYYASQATVEKPLRDASEAFDHFYELSFSPGAYDMDAIHSIEVKTNDPSLRVIAPKTFSVAPELREPFDKNTVDIMNKLLGK